MSTVPLGVVEKVSRPNLVEYIERMLEEAKTGELQGVCIVAEWKNGAVGEGWCDTGTQRYRLIGALTVLAHKLAEAE